MEAGVITNARKSIDVGTTVTGLLLGTERIYRFVHLNPAIRFEPFTYTHGADVLARIDNFVALNSAIEVDLTGQINAEEIAGSYVGSVGGAVDFLRGAARSRGGVPVIALRSTAGREQRSRIVARLSGPVSTARSDAGVIVTEHGIADLRGKSLRERRRLMIDIAPPHARAELDATAPAGRS
jgi:acetyl-CoA hydrolase